MDEERISMERNGSVSILALADNLRKAATQLLATRSGGAAPAEVLTRLMQRLITPDPDKEVAAVQAALFRKVVFMVFNFTPLREPERRIFTASLFWRNLASSTSSDVDRWERDLTIPQSADDYCECFIVPDSDDLDPNFHQRAKALWQARWSEYYQITRAGMAQNRYTWNQFLLKGAEFPQCAGICVGDQATAASCYALISRDTLDSLESAAQNGWLGSLDGDTDSHSQLELDAARALWRKSQPLGDHSSQILENVPWAVYHLSNTFGRWGGRAFISIPVTFGANAINRTAVLSISTVDPLTDREVADWALIAWNMFNPILAEEAIGMAAAAERVTVYEAIGHTLKSAVSITSWATRKREMLKIVEALPNAGVSPEQEVVLLSAIKRDKNARPRTLAQVFRQTANAFANFAFAESLGGLVRLISALESGRWSKMSGWVDEDALQRWESCEASIVHQYADVVYSLAQVACRASGWPSFQVEVFVSPAATLPVTKFWNSGMPIDEQVAPGKLSMPPFSRESDAAFALLPSILEPISNAVKASTKDRNRDTTVPVRIRIIGELPSRIRIEIGNPHSERFEGDLPSGLKDTAILIEKVGIARFEPRVESELICAGRYVVWVRLDLVPQELARRIIAHVKGM
jgi:hypothetical protein